MYMVKSFLENLVSDATRRSYKAGLRKFEEFYGKSPKFLLKDKEASKTIERFYISLRKKYTQNSCRALVNPIVQYMKYNGIRLHIRKSLGIYRTTITTRDHMLNVSEIREMYKVASLEEKVMIKIWLLGLRIGDACRLEKKLFISLPPEELVEILIYTKKEGVVAHSFIDKEFKELLMKHLPNLDTNNPYIFQSEKGDFVKEKQLLRRLQSLQNRAHIKPRGCFGWHIARKLFLRTCAENGINQWNAKLLVGKSVSKDILTYINGISLKNDAEKVLNVLSMEKREVKDTGIEEALDLVMKTLRKMIEVELKKKRKIAAFSRMLTDKEVLESYLEGRKNG